MKLSKLFVCIGAAALALVACNKEPQFKGDDMISDGEPKFMTVNLDMKSDFGGTKADPTADDFTYGTAAEYQVNNVRFYFFKANGDAALVCKKGNTMVSYFDWDNPTSVAEKPEHNIDNVTSIKIVINTKEGDALPSKIVAVCNRQVMWTTPGETAEDKNVLPESPTLEQLRTLMFNTQAMSNVLRLNTTGIEAGKFVFSNTAYVDETGREIWAAEVLSSNIAATEAEATAHPVTIYVERVLAKIQGAISSSIPTDNIVTADSKTYFKTGATYTEDGTTYDVVAEITGWNVTGAAPAVNLGKKINPEWNYTTLLQTENWNDYVRHRSYWEYSPRSIANFVYDYQNHEEHNTGRVAEFGYGATEDMVLIYGNYSDAKFRQIGENNNSAYIYPNAGHVAATGEHVGPYTQVIVAATLRKYDGSTVSAPVTLCNWLGTDYTLDGLKTAIADYSAQEIFYFTGVDGDGNYKYKSVTAADLDFLTMVGGASVPAGENRRYAAWAEIAETSANRIWFSYDGTTLTLLTDVPATYYTDGKLDPAKFDTTVVDGQNVPVLKATELTEEGDTFAKKFQGDLNNWLTTTQPAKIWTSGQTYYFFDIAHLGKQEVKDDEGHVTAAAAIGAKGVVRNHYYTFNITGVFGLGTPVYNGTEIIIPEETRDQYSYVAANLKVLSWRKVSQNVDLGK